LKERIVGAVKGARSEGERPVRGVFGELARGLASGGDANDLMHKVVRAARDSCQADGAFIERALSGRTEVEVAVATGAPVPEVGTRIPYPGSLAEEVISRGEPEILEPLRVADRLLGGSFRELCPGCSGLILPLMAEGDSVGALVLVRRAGKPGFEPDEAAALIPLADLSAVAIHWALLHEQAMLRQRELEESERRFGLLVSGVRDYAIFTLDARSEVTSWNEGAERIIGYSRAEILGQDFSIFFTEEDRARDWPRNHLAAAERDGTYSEEGWRVRRDGSRFRSHSLVTSLRDEAGALVGFGAVARDLTERDRLEQQRRLEEERYRTLYHHNPSIFVTTDSRGTIVEVNEYGAEYLGYSPDELVGSSILDLVPDPDRGAYLEHLGKTLRDPGSTGRLETRKIRKDDGVIWVRENSRAIPDPSGSMLVLHSCEDITDRVDAHVALRRSEEQLRQLTEHLSEVLWVADSTFSRVTYVSPSYEDVWGDPRDRLYADPERFLQLIAPADRGRAAAALRRMATEPFETEFQVVRPDGERRVVSCRGFPVRLEDGVVERVVGIAEDITQRRKVEERRNFLLDAGRVLASSLDYERTLENLAQLAVSSLADWCVIDILEGDAIRRVAVAHSDPSLHALAARYREEFPPDPGALTGGPKVIRTGRAELLPRITRELLEASFPDERQREILTGLGFTSGMSVPLKIENRVLGAITLICSQLGLTYGEDDLQTAELLAGRAALAIDKARLYRRAQEATTLREEVLSVVSHDLRNPLNTIVLSAGVLRESLRRSDPRINKQVDIICRSAEQMNHLIRDLLDVARIEAGSLRIDPQEYDPRALAEEGCQNFRHHAEEKGIELVCTIACDLPPVRVDRGRLLQVFDNLIDNAVKFTPQGGRIELRGVRCEDRIRFSIVDTGTGIDAAELPRLFDRFYQSSRNRKGGAGLGLAIVKGIVETHGGSVDVASELGRGSTFSFEVPVAD
jgi:PAS domain S-box-containing protein